MSYLSCYLSSRLSRSLCSLLVSCYLSFLLSSSDVLLSGGRVLAGRGSRVRLSSDLFLRTNGATEGGRQNETKKQPGMSKIVSFEKYSLSKATTPGAAEGKYDLWR